MFVCLNSLFEHFNRGYELPVFNMVLIDECHHVGAQMYEVAIRETRAGRETGPFLLRSDRYAVARRRYRP